MMLRAALRTRRVIPAFQLRSLRLVTPLRQELLSSTATTAAAPTNPVKEESNSSILRKPKAPKRHPATLKLHRVTSRENRNNLNSDQILSEMEEFFKNFETHDDYLKFFKHSLSSTHILFSKLEEEQATDALRGIFCVKRFMNIMYENEAAFPTIIVRAVKHMLAQKRFDDALEIAEKGLAIVEKYPVLATEEKLKHLQFEEIDVANRVHYFTYLASCYFKGVEPSEEYYNKLPGSLSHVPIEAILKRSSIDVEVLRGIKKLDSKIQLKNSNANSPKIWEPVFRAARKTKSSLVDEMVNEIKETAATNGTPFNEIAYSSLMDVYCADGRFQLALDVFKEMTANKIQPTILSWERLLYAHSRIMSADICIRVESVMKLMEQLNIKPDTKCYNSLAYAYIISGEFEKANELVAQIKSQNNPQINISAVIQTCVSQLLKRGKLEEALEMTKKYEVDGTYKRDIIYYNALITHYFRVKDVKSACEIIDVLMSPNSTIKPDPATFTNIIYSILNMSKKSGKVPIQELKWILSLMKEKSVIPNQVTLSAIIDSAFESKKMADFARAIFDFMKLRNMPISSRIYTIVINGEVNAGSIEGAISNYGLAVNDGTPIDQKLYNIIFNGFCRIPDVEPFVVESFYKHVKLSQAKPNFYTFFYLLKYAANRNDMEFAQMIVNEIENSNIPHLGKENPKILKKLMESGNLEIPPRVARLMKESLEEN